MVVTPLRRARPAEGEPEATVRRRQWMFRHDLAVDGMHSMLVFGAKHLFQMYWSLRYTEQAVERTCAMATESTDEKKNRQLLGQLLDKPGNGTCADCGAPGIPIRWVGNKGSCTTVCYINTSRR